MIEIDGDLVKALQWCRLGKVRPEHDSAFHRARDLGLLARDPVWRTTAQGDGVLVAAGLLKGQPSPEQVGIVILWARHLNRGASAAVPQFVAAFSDDLVEAMPHAYGRQSAHVEREYRSFFDDGEPIEFFTTVEHTPRPPRPDTEAQGDTA